MIERAVEDRAGESRGAGLAYFRGGRGEPLLLVHAFWRAWEPVLPALLAERDVIGVDLPGFGASERPPTDAGLGLAAMADAVEALLDRLELARLDIAGNSLGASVAVELAKRGRASSLTVIAPLGLGTKRENRRTSRRLALVRTSSRFAGPMIPLVARSVVGRTIFAGGGLHLARPWRHERDAMIVTVRDYLSADAFAPAFSHALEREPEGLEAIAVPVVIAWGQRDRIASARQARRWADRIANASFEVLEGCGHVPMSDDADAVTRLVLRREAQHYML